MVRRDSRHHRRPSRSVGGGSDPRCIRNGCGGPDARARSGLGGRSDHQHFHRARRDRKWRPARRRRSAFFEFDRAWRNRHGRLANRGFLFRTASTSGPSPSATKRAGRAIPTAMDREAAVMVEQELRRGRDVLLHVLDASKTGLMAVTRQTARSLAAAAPGRVRVVIDACQLRSPLAQLQRDLADGFMVTVTGSKFAGGPPFSGALLLPAAIAEEVAALGSFSCRIVGLFSRSRLAGRSSPPARFFVQVRSEYRAWSEVGRGTRRHCVSRVCQRDRNRL